MMGMPMVRHFNELPERLEAAKVEAWLERDDPDEDPPDVDGLLQEAADAIRQLAQWPRHDPQAGAQFLLLALAPEGIKPHPLDTVQVMLPAGVDVYDLLADACESEARRMFDAGYQDDPETDALRRMAKRIGQQARSEAEDRHQAGA